jgi:type III secretion protein U
LAALLAFAGLRDHAIDFARTSGRWAAVGVVIGGVGTPLLWRVALVCVALGALDLLVTRQAWIRRLRMTKDEVTREQKESEGDPHMKAARARAHRELLTQAAIASVRTANVVVVNPIHLACALRYDERAGDPAPVVVASGEGEIAAEIARAAWTFAVPLVTDVPLARALYELAVGETIPETLYEAVAEVLRELGSRQPRPDPPRAAS